MYLDGRGFLFTSGETPLALMNFFLVSATLLVDLMERKGVVVWYMCSVEDVHVCVVYNITQTQPINITGCNRNFTCSLSIG